MFVICTGRGKLLCTSKEARTWTLVNLILANVVWAELIRRQHQLTKMGHRGILLVTQP